MIWASVNFPSARGADVRPSLRRTGQPEKNSSLVLRLATTVACRSGSGRALGRARVLPAHTGRHVISAFDGRWRARLKANPYALDHSLGGSIEALKAHRSQSFRGAVSDGDDPSERGFAVAQEPFALGAKHV